MKPLAILRMGSTFNELSRVHGDFVDWVAAGTGLDDGRLNLIDAKGGAPLPSPDRIGGAILTGSHQYVTDAAPWSERVATWLQGAFTSGLPLLGICYGHQLIARALGGYADVNPAGLEFGTVEITTAVSALRDPLFQSLAPRFHAHTCHAQTVLQLPPGATLLAVSDRDAHQAFRVGSNCWGVQFHPEFDMPATRHYIDYYQGPLAAQGNDPEKLRAGLKPTPRSNTLLAAFAVLADAAQDGTPLE